MDGDVLGLPVPFLAGRLDHRKRRLGGEVVVNQLGPVRGLCHLGEELGEAVNELSAVRDAEKEVSFSIAGASRVLEESESESLGLFDLGDADLDEQSWEKRTVRNLYRKVGSTREWAENNYYRLPIQQQIAELITPNAFWHDLALWDGQQPFLSKHFIHAHTSFAECMLALGVLDLPFQASEHPETQEDDSRTFTAGNGLLVFRSEMREAPLAEEQAGQLLVSQNFYRHGDRYRREGNQQFDKFVTDEFLVGAVYGCELVVTNSTSTPVQAEVVYQIPSGAVPVSGSRVVLPHPARKAAVVSALTMRIISETPA